MTARNVAQKIVLIVRSAIAPMGKTETTTSFTKRSEKAKSDVTLYTKYLDKKDRMETVKECIARNISEMDNPVYTIKSITEHSFQPAY